MFIKTLSIGVFEPITKTIPRLEVERVHRSATKALTYCVYTVMTMNSQLIKCFIIIERIVPNRTSIYCHNYWRNSPVKNKQMVLFLAESLAEPGIMSFMKPD